MKVKNLTPETQKIEFKELTGDRRVYDIYVMPNSCTDLEKGTILNLEKLAGIIEVEGNVIIPVQMPVIPVEENEESQKPEIIEDSSDDNESGEGEDEETDPIVEDSGVQEDDKFICDICGAEYGSARGLSSHRNRVHNEG